MFKLIFDKIMPFIGIMFIIAFAFSEGTTIMNIMGVLLTIVLIYAAYRYIKDYIKYKNKNK